MSKEFEASGRPLEKWSPPFFPHGFMFDAYDLHGQNKEPATKAREALMTEQAPLLGRPWGRRWQPPIRRIAAPRCEKMTLPDLRRHAIRCLDSAAQAFAITLVAAGPMLRTGVRVGTRRIRDGMKITVDGTQGIVRIED